MKSTRNHAWMPVAGCLMLFSFSAFQPARLFAADWPMLRHDARRTGRSPDSPHPPFTLAWHHTIPDERIAAWNQPILAEDRVFIGTLEGVMHCWPLDEKRYKECGGRDLWSFAAGGPIVQAAGYSDGRVFFGSFDGCCYALDAAGGELLWKFDGGRPGFSQAALPAEGRVFLGNRAGVFFAFDQRSGEILWRHEAGAPFMASAAYADGRVYCVDEDMIVSALDAQTGELLWKSEKLRGSGVLVYYPVVDSGKVVIRAKPYSISHAQYYSFSIAVMESGANTGYVGWYNFPEAAWKAGGDYWRNTHLPRSQRLVEYNSAMRAAFAGEPEAITFHVLDAATGKRSHIVPITHNMVNTGPAEPMVVGWDGFWYAGTTVSGRGNECGVVKIDPATGDIVDALQEYAGGGEDGWGGKTYNVMPDGSLSEQVFLTRWIGDENKHFSIGGDILYGRHGHGGWDGVNMATRLCFKTHDDYRRDYPDTWAGRGAQRTYEINRVMGFEGNAFSGLAISGPYLVGTQIAGFGRIFCVKSKKENK